MDRSKTERKIQQYLEARRAGNLSAMTQIQDGLKGAEMTLLARALQNEGDKALVAAQSTTPNNAATPGPKETTMAKSATISKPTLVRPAPKANPAPKATAKPTPSPVAPRPEPRVGNVIKAQYRGDFKQVEGYKTASGAQMICTNFDEVAAKLAGADSMALKQIARDYDIEYTWEHLNPGMQRMNLGNRMRALIRKGLIELGSPVAKAPKKAKTAKKK